MTTEINYYIEQLYQKAVDRIEMNYIHAISKKDTNSDVELNEILIENYLKKRGYVSNNISKVKIYTKGFVCCSIHKDSVEVWHDITGSKHNFINGSLLTGLPITLGYMERIN